MTEHPPIPPATEVPPTSTPDATRRYGAAHVRRAIINVMADGQARTPREIEQAVAMEIPDAERAAVRDQVAVLHESGHVIGGRPDHRRLELSDSGKRWWKGIQALTPQPM